MSESVAILAQAPPSSAFLVFCKRRRMVLPDEACRFWVGGTVVAVQVLGIGGDVVQRDLVALALRRARAAVARVAEAELALLVAERAAIVAEEARADAEARTAGWEEWDLVSIGGGMSRFRDPADDDRSDSEEPVELQLPAAAATRPEAAAALAEPSAASLLARRVAEAHAVGQSLRACLADGSAPPKQAQWVAPGRSRCWAVLRAGTDEDVGIYSRWVQGAAEKASVSGAIVYGFPSIAEARALFEGAGRAAVDLRR